MLGVMLAVYFLVDRNSSRLGDVSPYSRMAPAAVGEPIPGLVAAFSFDEGGGTWAADASGNGNIATIVNAVWTTSGKYGNALVFNGKDALVTVKDAASLDLTTGMTLEAWVKPFAIPPDNCIPTSSCSWMDVIHKDRDRYYIEASSNHDGEPEAGGIFVSPWASLLHFHIRTQKNIVFGPSALPLHAWTYLALTYDSEMIRLYVNGVLVSTSPERSPITASAKPLCIGGDPTQGQFFNGIIDEVRVYNVALTAGQIQADMVTPLGTISARN